MRTAFLACLLLLWATLLPGADNPRVRPAEWAQPVIGTSLGNCYRVSADVYRSEQPDQRDLPGLKTLGLRSLVSLYEFFPDPRAFEQAGLRNVNRIRVQFSEPDDELAREVLVKQQLHRATRLPTRAANSYTARKSSGSSSG